MVWAIETGTLGTIQWAQWVDAAAFASWQWRLRDLYALPFLDHAGSARSPELERAARARLAARGVAVTADALAAEVYQLVAGQWSYLLAVWECLANMLRAMNQPALACPSYVNAWVGLMGSTPTSPTGTWANAAEALADRYSARFREGRRCEPSRDGETICELDTVVFPVPRIYLRENSTVNAELLRAVDAPAPVEGVDERWPRDASGDYLGARWRGAPYATFGDYAGAGWWPGAGSARRMGVENVLMSGFDSLQMAHGVAISGQLARRSWREIVSRSRLYAIAWNLSQAAKYGGESAEDIAAINAEYDVLRYTSTGSEELYGAAVEAYASLASALGSPVYGAIVRGLQLGVEALLDSTGRAQGREVDPFGRTEPVYQPWWIAGAITDTDRRAPSFVVPMAPRVEVELYPLAGPAPRSLPSDFTRGVLPLALPLGNGPLGSGSSSEARELDPRSVAAEAARRWGVDPRRGL